MTQPESLRHKIAFSLAKGMVGDTALSMLRRAGSAQAFFQFTTGQLSALTSSRSQIFTDSYRSELLKRAEREELFVTSNGIKAMWLGEDTYPQRLANCPDAPVMLYSLGRCDLNFQHAVAIVGTRHATHYGIEFTAKLVSDLARKLPGVAIVSGLAYGIDVAAHRAALDADTPTVAVMAHGLNTIYPSEHRTMAARIVEKGGAIVTEYTSDYQLNRGSFLARNRIVAGLCDCTVVVESDYKGGALATARIASAYNRDVFAVPGRTTDIYSRGTNRLIANNAAALITCADDLIACMNWTAHAEEPEQPALFIPLSDEQQAIIDFITERPDCTINDICVGLGINYASASDRIFQLELADRLAMLPGGRFSIN